MATLTDPVGRVLPYRIPDDKHLRLKELAEFQGVSHPSEVRSKLSRNEKRTK
jgi:hypothetical protein